MKTFLWECSAYSSIRKEFIRNLDGVLQNDFHQLIRQNTFLIIVFGHFDDWFSNAIFLCGIWNLRREKLHPSGLSDLVLYSSIN